MFIGSEKPCWGEFNKLLTYCIVSLIPRLESLYRAPEISGAQFRPNVASARAILEKLSCAQFGENVLCAQCKAICGALVCARGPGLMEKYLHVRA